MGVIRNLLRASCVLAIAGAVSWLSVGVAVAYEPELPPWIGEYLEHPPGLPPPPPPPPPEGGSPPAEEANPVLPTIEMAPVIRYDDPIGQTVRIYVRGGYCVGEPPPSIARVTLHEHRLPGQAEIAAVVTALLRWPAPLETATGASPTSVEGSSQPVSICNGVEDTLHKRLRLGHAPDEVILLDGSKSPRRRIPAG